MVNSRIHQYNTNNKLSNEAKVVILKSGEDINYMNIIKDYF